MQQRNLLKNKLVPYALEIADEKYRATFLNGLHERIELNPFQLRASGALFAGYNVVASVGRKAGKSTCVQYIALRKAALFKRAYCYVVLPLLKQAKEIYWEQLIIPDICPPGFIKKLDKGDLRITFGNGSFIKFDGSDNPELHRGPAVHLFIADELKDCEPALMPAMMPNLLATRGNFATFGTPPDEMESPKAKMWFEMVDRHLIDPKTKFFEGTSEENPFADKDFLRREKDRLYATGQEDVWLREYCGKYRRSTSESIFPMWADKDHVFKHEDLIDEVNSLSDIEWWVIQDPGSASVFAQLFLAYHKPTAMVYVLDESYVTDPKKATVLEMYRVEVEKCGTLQPNLAEWKNLYDEQAVWFFNERVMMSTADSLMPTEKNKWRVTFNKDLKAGLTIARDMMTHRRLKVSERCQNFCEEIRGYRKSQVKRKSKDHLIDCLRYFILKSYYTIPKEIIEDMSMISRPTLRAVTESTKAKGLQPEDLDAMLENDISELFISEAMEWDGW